MRKRWIFWAPLAIVAFLLFVALGGHIVRLLWNGLLPALFGFPQITFWQALGLLALCRILFGGFGMGGGSGSHYRRRWEAMTPEERERVRERMRARMRERWGRPSTSESKG
jgi:predicted Fe-S protein YdhL (DUF1289 family)